MQLANKRTSLVWFHSSWPRLLRKNKYFLTDCQSLLEVVGSPVWSYQMLVTQTPKIVEFTNCNHWSLRNNIYFATSWWVIGWSCLVTLKTSLRLLCLLSVQSQSGSCWKMLALVPSQNLLGSKCNIKPSFFNTSSTRKSLVQHRHCGRFHPANQTRHFLEGTEVTRHHQLIFRQVGP